MEAAVASSPHPVQTIVFFCYHVLVLRVNWQFAVEDLESRRILSVPRALLPQRGSMTIDGC